MRSSGRTRVVVLALAALAAAAVAWLALRGGEEGVAPARISPDAHEADGASAEATRGASPRAGERADAAPAARASAPALAAPGPDARDLLRGRVVDEAGAAVEGARVEVRAAGPSPVDFERELASDAAGEFELEVPERAPLLVRAAASGFAPAWRAPVFGGEAVTLVLRAPGRLEVAVQDAAGATIAGAEVRAWVTPGARSSRAPAWRGVLLTDAEGLARFDDAPRADLSVLARSGRLVEARRRVDLSEETEARLVLVLAEGLRLHGRVVAAADGAPLAGARVGCDALGHAETDADGRYELRGIAPTMSAWGIGAARAGFRPTWEYVRIDEESGDVELDFALAPAPALRARVVDGAGQPVAGARVVAEGRQPTKAFTGEQTRAERTSAGDGSFVIDPVHPMSRWTLELTGPHGGRARVEAGPFPPDVAVVDLGELALARSASIRGELEGDSSASNARVALRARPQEGAGRVVAVAWPDPWGAFRFDELAPGRYLVELHAGEELEEGLPLAVADVELEAGAEERVALALGRARIAGRVVDPSGRPAKRAALEFTALDDAGRTVARGPVGDEAAFDFAVPGFGEHTLVLRDPTLRYEEERVPGVLPDGPELVVRLRERTGGGRIDGHLRRADGRPVDDVTVAFRDAESFRPLGRVAVPEETGAFAIGGLEEGPYFVEVVDFRGRYEPRDPLLVRPGGAPVEIVLEPRS